jgi:hypothetical protein
MSFVVQPAEIVSHQIHNFLSDFGWNESCAFTFGTFEVCAVVISRAAFSTTRTAQLF